MKYKYLLFDLDGMLVDTLEGVVKSAQYALKHFGIEADITELDPFLGPPLTYSFMTYYNFTPERAAEAVAKYRERYDVKGVEECRLFDEVPGLLDDLKNAGYILGVATSKYEAYAGKMLNKLGIGCKFEYITGSNLEETISTKDEVIEEALRRFGISDKRSEALMIGDMKYDDIGAKKAGIDCFGVYTGTASPGEHESNGATYIAYSFEELRKTLLDWAKD